jgi:hypothetical protein
MLLTHFIWQTVLKPLSGTNAKNGAITPSLTPTMQARCYNAGKWVRATWRGITNLSKHVGALLVLYLGILWMALLVLVLVLGILWMSLNRESTEYAGSLVILWMSLRGESFHGIGVLVLGDLVTWRHLVRASRGPLSVLL